MSTDSPAFASEDLYAIKPKKSGKDICWFGEVYRHGVPYRKTFTAYRYGSCENALEAARAWRDEIVQSVRPLTRAEYSNIERANNTSGYPGVYLMKTLKKNDSGHESAYFAWEARSPTGMKPARKKSFSILKYGEAKAYDLAVAARKSFVDQLDGFVFNRVPDHLREKVVANDDPIANG